MKLSELSTDKALDVLCELMPCIANIIEDEQIVNGLDAIIQEKSSKREGANGFNTGIRVMGGLANLAPVLLQTHRNDMYIILSVLNEKSVSDIASQPVADTIRQVREIFKDSDLLSFFKSSMQREQTEPSVPSVDSPDSE